MLIRAATVLVIMVASVGSADFDWCKHDCKSMFSRGSGDTHTMCRKDFPEGGGPHCQGYKMGLNDQEKKAIVDLHNKMRAKVANGLETRGYNKQPQPSASNMMELVWDEEMAMIAQRWADQCRYGGHDSCRKTMDGIDLGQNAGAMSGYGTNPSRISMIDDRINAWYNEVVNMEPSDVDSVFRSSTGEIGHYTQAVWAKSSRIGCGLAHLNRGSFAMKIVCNYKPRGNVISTPVYLRGEPASKCPKNSERSKNYDGLCKSNGKEVFEEPKSQLISFPSFNSASQAYDDLHDDDQMQHSPSGVHDLNNFHNLDEIRNFMLSSMFPQFQSGPIASHKSNGAMSAPHSSSHHSNVGETDPDSSSDLSDGKMSAPHSSSHSSHQHITFSFPTSKTPDVIVEIPMSPGPN